MEIKHTIEILTKDIQDIEKLVRNLNNYPSPPQIEIDLAMSRLRQVYDLLSMISRDARNDSLKGDATYPQAPTQAPQSGQTQDGKPGTAPTPTGEWQTGAAPPAAPTGEPQTGARHPETQQVQPEVNQVQPEKQQVQPEVNEVQPEKQHVQPEVNEVQPGAQESPADQQQGTAPQQQAAQEPPADQQQGTAPQQQAAQEPPADREQPVPPPQSPGKNADTGQTATTTTRDKDTTSKKASILAEKFASDKSINERIAPGPGTDLSSKLTGEPIDSIKRNIGINDRFLIIRELLDGNNDGFNNLVQQLDTQQSFDEAYSLILSSFPEQMEHDGVNLLVRLARRRYLSR